MALPCYPHVARTQSCALCWQAVVPSADVPSADGSKDLREDPDGKSLLVLSQFLATAPGRPGPNPSTLREALLTIQAVHGELRPIGDTTDKGALLARFGAANRPAIYSMITSSQMGSSAKVRLCTPYITVTSLSHHRYITVTSPLHHRYITVTSPSRHRHITVTSP